MVFRIFILYIDIILREQLNNYNCLINYSGERIIYNYHNDYSLLTSDYNNIYSTSSYFNFNDFKTQTGGDSNSVSFNPNFVSDTDFHNHEILLNAHGIPLPEVTDDIDGEPRDATTPDIGADEFETAIYVLGDNINACAYDTVTLDAGNEYDSYSWSNGAATRFTDVDTTGIGLDSIKLVSTVMLGGIEDIAGNPEITLYPNPTDGKLFMSFEKPFKDIRLSVINMEGQVVLSRLLNDVQKGFVTELDLSRVPSGIYFIRFTNKEISRTARIAVR